MITAAIETAPLGSDLASVMNFEVRVRGRVRVRVRVSLSAQTWRP